MSERNFEPGEIMLDEGTILKRVEELADEITADYNRDYPGETLLLICILKGSFVFTADLSRKLGIDTRIDFMSVSSYGSGTVTSGKVKIIKDLETDIAGKNVLIVEDIIDSGVTLSALRKILLDRNPKSLKICTLLDKPSGRKVDITGDYLGFIIEDRFIVGYGLDVDEKFRDLPDIVCIKEG